MTTAEGRNPPPDLGLQPMDLVLGRAAISAVDRAGQRRSARKGAVLAPFPKRGSEAQLFLEHFAWRSESGVQRISTYGAEPPDKPALVEVRIWSNKMRPDLPWKRTRMREGAGRLPVLIGAAMMIGKQSFISAGDTICTRLTHTRKDYRPVDVEDLLDVILRDFCIGKSPGLWCCLTKGAQPLSIRPGRRDRRSAASRPAAIRLQNPRREGSKNPSRTRCSRAV
jgi:hypothetical protein